MGALIASVFVLASILFSVGIDVRNNQNDFSKSFTGQKLKEYGGYEYGHLAYQNAADITNKTVTWAVENVPIYVATTREHLKPYIKLGTDLSKIAYNVSKRAYQNLSWFVSEKFPYAENWYVYYLGFCFLPGPATGVVQAYSLVTHMQSMMPNRKVQEQIPVVRESIYTAMNATKQGAVMAIDAARTHGANAANYIRNEVFVGEWSPENLQKHTKRAYDSTHNLAVNTASWVMDKVRSLSGEQH